MGLSLRGVGRSGLQVSSLLSGRELRTVATADREGGVQAAGLCQLWAAVKKSSRPPVQWSLEDWLLLLHFPASLCSYCSSHPQAPAERVFLKTVYILASI